MNAAEAPFDKYGFDPNDEKSPFMRIPYDIAKTINDGVRGGCGFAAGGRIRFRTNSKSVGIKVTYGECITQSVGDTTRNRWGINLYRKKNGYDVPVYMWCPPYEGVPTDLEGMYRNEAIDGMEEYTILFPGFARILTCEIGVEEGAVIEEGEKYVNDKPVIFYGSSIVNGAGATNPGSTYEQVISRKYNMDYVNLGFAGWAKGEKEMADYIASREMCLFVCDYDHNAPDAEHLAKTYPVIYKTIREKYPEIPYIVISKPDFVADNEKEAESNAKRREFIKGFAEKMQAEGDKNIWFIDGKSFFPEELNLCCTADTCHPNDLGYSLMAEKIGSKIAEILNLKPIY